MSAVTACESSRSDERPKLCLVYAKQRKAREFIGITQASCTEVSLKAEYGDRLWCSLRKCLLYSLALLAFSMNVAATFLRDILPVAPLGMTSTTHTLTGTLNWTTCISRETVRVVD